MSRDVNLGSTMTPRLHPHASASGKVILVGEHAVVYGQPALAAGLPDGLELWASPLDRRTDATRLVIPEWQLDLVLTPDNDHPVARATLEVLGFCDGPLTGWRITGTSRLPSRAGCGSSAALSVALARLVLGDEAAPADIIEASLAGERVFHGNPSGIDNLVATTGGIVRFVKGQPAAEIAVKAPLPLLVVPTGIPRSTAAQVTKVRERLARLPSIVRPILDAIGHATDDAISSINSCNYNILGEIFTVTHELLSSLGVSCPALDSLQADALVAGALGAKLTGAGGGGCLLVLPPADPSPVIDAMRARGLEPLAVEVR